MHAYAPECASSSSSRTAARAAKVAHSKAARPHLCQLGWQVHVGDEVPVALACTQQQWGAISVCSGSFAHPSPTASGCAAALQIADADR